MKKRIMSFFVAITLVLTMGIGLSPNTVKSSAQSMKLFDMPDGTAGTYKRNTDGNLKPAVSGNAYRQNYYDGYEHESPWAKVISSYQYINKDGRLTRLENIGSNVVIEDYEADGKLYSQRVISLELPLFGGFIEAENNYYIVVGDNNEKENPKKEVFRIVKYTKDWKRVNSASLYGANSHEMFCAGSLRAAVYGDMIYIRTSHSMFMEEDDVMPHQANMTVAYDQSTSKITYSTPDLVWYGTGYISHSFNQFIKIDGDKIVALDHGDIFPRSIALSKFNGKAGSKTFEDEQIPAIDIVKIPGSSSDPNYNYTGISVGGFEVSKSDYLVAYNMVEEFPKDSKGNVILPPPFGDHEVRNVYVASIDKNDNTGATVVNKKITNFPANGNKKASNPVFVKVSDDEFVLMWEVYTHNSKEENYKPAGVIQYVSVDSEGNTVGQIKEMYGYLSDCEPKIIDGKINWFVTDGTGSTMFYVADKNTAKLEVVDSKNPSTTPILPSENNRLKQPEKPNNNYGTYNYFGIDSGDSGSFANGTVANGKNAKKSGKYKIVKKPGKVKIKKAKRKGKKKIYITWKKVSKASKYEIWYSLKKNFKKSLKKKKVKKCKATLKVKKKTYYVKVRALRKGYITTAGKVGYRKGSWSKVKKIKLKK